MWKLSDVLATKQPSDLVMATDVRLKNGSVVKQFFAASLDQLIERRKQHEHVHWYEVIDEHKPARIFLDIETCAASHERVLEGVRLVIQLLTTALGTNAPWHVADASDDHKRSFHVVGGPLMENLYHVGAAVRRLRWFAEINRADMCAPLFDDKGECIIDEAVYTRGRQFRIFGACKLGSSRVLRSDTPWWQALVNGAGPAMTMLEIDEKTTPVSTNRGALDLFQRRGDEFVSADALLRTQLRTHVPMCVRPVIEAMYAVDHEIQRWDMEFCLRYGSWRLPSRGTRCLHAGRAHKSNHVWYTVDPLRRVVEQRCHDPECRGQATPVPLDDAVWNQVHAVFSSTVPE